MNKLFVGHNHKYNMKEYYTYMLINPITCLPFYIGKGKGNRAYSHSLNYDPHNHHKSGTINKIRKEGKEPVVCILKENLSDSDAKKFETKLIDHYGKYNDGGILTNIADGGQGGYTGPVSKQTSEKLSWANSGENNSNCKLSSEQVREIYYRSDKTISNLGREYQIGGAEIRKIKLRKSWSPITLFLVGRPGFHYKNRFEFFTNDELEQEIIDIYLDNRPTSRIAIAYSMTFFNVARIKNKELYSEYTENLILPEVVFRGLSNSQRHKIKNSTREFIDLADEYDVCLETIRNIKNNYYK